MRLMVHLYNFQTSQVGINQILNTFCEKDIYYQHGSIEDGASYLLPQL